MHVTETREKILLVGLDAALADVLTQNNFSDALMNNSQYDVNLTCSLDDGFAVLEITR